MALQGAPFFGNSPASTSAKVEVQGEQQYGSDTLIDEKASTSSTNISLKSSTCAEELIKSESVIAVATSDNLTELDDSESGHDENDANLSSPENSPIREFSPHPVSDDTSSSPPHVSVAVHFVGAPGRACAHCRTMKTPLWRNGPLGPKTLCNACGIRFKLGKLQVSSNGQNLEPAGTKVSGGVRKRPFPSDAPRTPPRKLRHLNRKVESLSQRFSHRPIKHREHTGSMPRRAHLPILTNHDGALILLQLAGVF